MVDTADLFIEPSHSPAAYADMELALEEM